MSWNYRVIEFSMPSEQGSLAGEPWRSIHEVYYHEDGSLSAYSATPAVIGWDLDEGDAAPLLIMERMRAALDKPVLRESDFPVPNVVPDDVGPTIQ